MQKKSLSFKYTSFDLHSVLTFWLIGYKKSKKKLKACPGRGLRCTSVSWFCQLFFSLQQLHEVGIYSQIKKFAGSGFGGLVATLLAAGAGFKTMDIWLSNDIPKLTSGLNITFFKCNFCFKRVWKFIIQLGNSICNFHHLTN